MVLSLKKNKNKNEKKSHFNQRKPVEDTRYAFSFRYVLNFRFKDGKIRIDAPVVTEIKDANASGVRKGIDDEDVYKEIESMLNRLCDKLISAKKVEEDW